MIRFHLAGILSAALLWASPVHAGCGAEGFVTVAGNAFFAAAQSGSPQAFTSAAARYADLRGIALFSLGHHRKLLPKAKEAEYIALTRSYMGRFLATHSGKLTGSNLQVTDCVTAGKSLLVKAKSSSGRAVSFRVSKGKSGYRVQDVSVSSFWLASQLRGKFVKVINAGGGNIDALFAFLRSGKVPGQS